MALTLDKIKGMTSDDNYMKGQRLCKEGGLVSFTPTFERGGGYALRATTISPSSHTIRHPRLTIDADGNVTDKECSCPNRADLLCEHQAALLLCHFYRTATKAKGAARATDRQASQMIRRYAQGDAAALLGSAAGSEKIRLEPELIWRGKSMDLLIHVGNRRMYIIKDIGMFADNVRDLSQVSYGKQLEFVHAPERFADDSQALLAFVLQRVSEARALHGNVYGGLYNAGDKRFLLLSPAALDAFFDLYLDKEILMGNGDGREQIRLCEEDPPLTVTLEERDGGVLLQMEPVSLVKGARRLYIGKGGQLLRCSEEYARKTETFLRFAGAGEQMFISGGDLGGFCENVLPAIRETLRVSGGGRALEENMPRDLEALLYLDAPTRGTVVCTAEYCYGQDKFNPFAQQNIAVRGRNRHAETAVEIQLLRWFGEYNTDSHRFVLDGDDETLFAFYDEGVPALMEWAVVHGTDRFRKAGILPPPRVAVGVSLEGGMLDISVDTGDFPTAELAALLNAYRANLKYYRLKDGRFQSIADGPLDGLAQIADGLDLSPRQLAAGHARVPSFRAAYLDGVLRKREDLRFDRDSAFKSLVRGLKNVEDSDYAVPASLAQVLRNYQKTGFRWLKTLEASQFGGILADDMGLGKTLQVITLLLSSSGEAGRLPSLVVCPASLILNWEAEIRRFAPSLPVRAILGDTASRAESIAGIAQGETVVTSYDLLRRDVGQYAELEFQYEIIDEAQYIKNATTQNAKSVKAVRSRQRFALTGTPMENRLSELWSIFDFLMPGYLFGYSAFRERLELPVMRSRDEKALERLGRMVRPFILRRMKRDVLAELPEKTETVVYAEMEGEQKRVYTANAAQMRQDLREKLQNEGWEQGGRIEMLAMLTRLRQICCDPRLCCADYSGESAKLGVFMELVRESLDSGHRLLVFSQFTSMLALLEARLDEEGVGYFLLKGDTPKEKRARLVEEFNRGDIPVFLISLKAGGVGLNLTGADVVIHYDPWWNVAAQNQATDRAHRIGQKNSVQVYKLIARGTIEEKILRLQQLKADLADSVIHDGDAALFQMTGDDIIQLLSDGAEG